VVKTVLTVLISAPFQPVSLDEQFQFLDKIPLPMVFLLVRDVGANFRDA
jgi:hypothetical protein